jgi:hypothetical protein
MISIQDFCNAVHYKFTDGSPFGWSCYGPNVFCLDSYTDDDYWSTVVFDTVTHVVYESSVVDYKNNFAYRIINPEYKSLVETEFKNRKLDIDEAFDEIRYTNIENDSEFLEKVRNITSMQDA